MSASADPPADSIGQLILVSLGGSIDFRSVVCSYPGVMVASTINCYVYGLLLLSQFKELTNRFSLDAFFGSQPLKAIGRNARVGLQ